MRQSCAAADGHRTLERKFREWLTTSHATLDKHTRFCVMASGNVQARARARLRASPQSLPKS